MAFEAILHGQNPGRLSLVVWIAPAKTQNRGAGGNHDENHSNVFKVDSGQHSPPTLDYQQSPPCQGLEVPITRTGAVQRNGERLDETDSSREKVWDSGGHCQRTYQAKL